MNNYLADERISVLYEVYEGLTSSKEGLGEFDLALLNDVTAEIVRRRDTKPAYFCDCDACRSKQYQFCVNAQRESEFR